jgi:hypothetical protein
MHSFGVGNNDSDGNDDFDDDDDDDDDVKKTQPTHLQGNMNFVMDYFLIRLCSQISFNHESSKCLSFFIPLRQNANVWLCDVSVVNMIPVVHQFRT